MNFLFINSHFKYSTLSFILCSFILILLPFVFSIPNEKILKNEQDVRSIQKRGDYSLDVDTSQSTIQVPLEEDTTTGNLTQSITLRISNSAWGDDPSERSVAIFTLSLQTSSSMNNMSLSLSVWQVQQNYEFIETLTSKWISTTSSLTIGFTYSELEPIIETVRSNASLELLADLCVTPSPDSNNNNNNNNTASFETRTIQPTSTTVTSSSSTLSVLDNGWGYHRVTSDEAGMKLFYPFLCNLKMYCISIGEPGLTNSDNNTFCSSNPREQKWVWSKQGVAISLEKPYRDYELISIKYPLESNSLTGKPLDVFVNIFDRYNTYRNGPDQCRPEISISPENSVQLNSSTPKSFRFFDDVGSILFRVDLESFLPSNFDPEQNNTLETPLEFLIDIRTFYDPNEYRPYRSSYRSDFTVAQGFYIENENSAAQLVYDDFSHDYAQGGYVRASVSEFSYSSPYLLIFMRYYYSDDDLDFLKTSTSVNFVGDRYQVNSVPMNVTPIIFYTTFGAFGIGSTVIIVGLLCVGCKHGMEQSASNPRVADREAKASTASKFGFFIAGLTFLGIIHSCITIYDKNSQPTSKRNYNYNLAGFCVSATIIFLIGIIFAGLTSLNDCNAPNYCCDYGIYDYNSYGSYYHNFQDRPINTSSSFPVENYTPEWYSSSSNDQVDVHCFSGFENYNFEAERENDYLKSDAESFCRGGSFYRACSNGTNVFVIVTLCVGLAGLVLCLLPCGAYLLDLYLYRKYLDSSTEPKATVSAPQKIEMESQFPPGIPEEEFNRNSV